MAKNTCAFSAIRWLVLLLCLACINCSAANTRAKLKETYLSQIGVHEKTGHNDGPQIAQYLKITGLPEGHPWCAAFVAYCFSKAELHASKSAYSPAWFPSSKVIWKQGKQVGTIGPRCGDVIGIWFKNLKRIGHVGFWHQDDGAFVITVEGNTNDAGSREGNRVAKKRRLKRQIHSISNWIDK